MSKFLRYLKPNFSSHWGNWLLAPLVAFFVGYLPFSVFAYDSADDPATAGYLYECSYGTADTPIRCARLYAANSYPENTYQVTWTNSDSGYVTVFYEGVRRRDVGFKRVVDPASNCPEAGSITTINVPLAYGSTLPEFYSIDGCQFVVTGFKCATETEFKREDCDVEGQYTGEEATAGPSPGDPGEKPQIRCYYPDGQMTQLIDYDASCPAGSTREPPDPDQCDPATEQCPTDPDPDQCDPATEQCPTDPNPDPDQCDPETEQCPADPDPEPDVEQGDPENGVADMGQTEMAQYCRDNPKAAQCAEYVHKKVEEADKGRFDIAAIDLEIEKKWLELDGIIQQTRTSIENKFSLSVSSGAGLPCFPFITWKGATEHVCLSDHADAFSKIAAVVLFICVVIGILIILR